MLMILSKGALILFPVSPIAIPISIVPLLASNLCAPAPNIHVDVGDPLAGHRRLLTHRLAFCAQIESGGRRPFLRGENAQNGIRNRQRQGGAAK